MTLKRGDIVLVDFPFADRRGSKRRPALVVQSDHNNRRLTNVILAAITSTTHRSAEPTQLFIEVSSPAGQQSGLLMDSVVTCENLLTIAQNLVRHKLGQLSPAAIQQLDSCLKASLGIP